MAISESIPTSTTAERHEGRVPTVIVGAGQSGLSTAYHLGRRGHRCVVLHEDARVGDVWRHRYDSLRLNTPAKWDGLLDSYDLSSVRPSDFEVVDWGPDLDWEQVECTRDPLGVPP